MAKMFFEKIRWVKRLEESMWVLTDISLYHLLHSEFVDESKREKIREEQRIVCYPGEKNSELFAYQSFNLDIDHGMGNLERIYTSNSRKN